MSFSEPDSVKREFIENTLIDIRDGLADVEDISKLQSLLQNDREARLIYLRANQLSNMLENSSVERQSPLQIQRIHFVSAVIGAGVAVAVALCISLYPFSQPAQTIANESEVEAEAYASLSSDYQAIIGGNPASLSQGFGEGELALERGIAQLSFQNGTVIVLEGQCGFEIIDEMNVILTHGKMWAYCPEDAYGFKVHTPGGREIVDLGTEFGIEIDSSGTTNVHVFDGLVDVVSLNAEPQRVNAGSAVHWVHADAPINRSEAQPDKFVSPNALANKRLQSYQERFINSFKRY